MSVAHVFDRKSSVVRGPFTARPATQRDWTCYAVGDEK